MLGSESELRSAGGHRARGWWQMTAYKMRPCALTSQVCPLDTFLVQRLAHQFPIISIQCFLIISGSISPSRYHSDHIPRGLACSTSLLFSPTYLQILDIIYKFIINMLFSSFRHKLLLQSNLDAPLPCSHGPQ